MKRSSDRDSGKRVKLGGVIERRGRRGHVTWVVQKGRSQVSFS